MATEHTYDVVVIGSGMAGLYAAHKLRKFAPRLRVCVLERNNKQGVGGRAGNEEFYGTEVVTGAGIGRQKDRLLAHLMQEQGFKPEFFPVVPRFAQTMRPLNMNAAWDLLHQEFRRLPPGGNRHTTFKSFAEQVLGKATYKRFLQTSGYTDYEKQDVEDTLFRYSMEDNMDAYMGFSVPWARLVESLTRHTEVISSVHVTTIERVNSDGPMAFRLHTNRGAVFRCARVIVATDIGGLRQLFPSSSLFTRKHIEGQSFLRLYAKFPQASVQLLQTVVPGHICVPGPLQKIIPMNPEKGVYMIAYSDNANANTLPKENTAVHRTFYERSAETALGLAEGSLHITAIRGFYWENGTHYCPPLQTEWFRTREEFLRAAQHPEDGVLVVGEVVSAHQGWVEGALESVEAVITRSWCRDICTNLRAHVS